MDLVHPTFPSDAQCMIARPDPICHLKSERLCLCGSDSSELDGFDVELGVAFTAEQHEHGLVLFAPRLDG